MNEKENILPHIAILGAGGHGTTIALATILAERGMKMSDVVVINSEDIEEVKLQIKDLPNDSIVLVENVGSLLSEIAELPKPEVFKLENTYRDMPRDVILTSDFYNNKSFGGHKKGKNRKLRRM